MKKISNTWFFTDTPWWLKWSLIFINGDALVFLPLIAVIAIISIYSLRFALIILGIYITIRYLGEMFYWIMQQFGARKYRPYDFGLKNLDNHALYIIYQTMCILWVVVGIGTIMWTILYLY